MSKYQYDENKHVDTYRSKLRKSRHKDEYDLSMKLLRLKDLGLMCLDLKWFKAYDKFNGQQVYQISSNHVRIHVIFSDGRFYAFHAFDKDSRQTRKKEKDTSESRFKDSLQELGLTTAKEELKKDKPKAKNEKVKKPKAEVKKATKDGLVKTKRRKK